LADAFIQSDLYYIQSMHWESMTLGLLLASIMFNWSR